MTAASRRARWSTPAFVVLMLGLAALFASLGAWQWQRLGEKERLIANVAARVNEPPLPLPGAAEWAALDPEPLDYRPVRAEGTYVPEATVLVFTSLSDPKAGPASGPGYWVMTPLRLAAGGTLFVNRGFVPESSASSFAQGGPVPGGTVAVSGLARISEPVTSFTPGTDFARRIEWVRNSERLAAMLPEELRPVAPVTLDLPAGPPGALPQAGETVMAFPNNHLGYALTWFGFAVLTPVLLGVWLLRQRRAV